MMHTYPNDAHLNDAPISNSSIVRVERRWFFGANSKERLDDLYRRTNFQ
jgi:hypothetical protein